MWSALRQSWRPGGRGERGARALAFTLGMLGLFGCDFSDVVEIGSHSTGGTAPREPWPAHGGGGAAGSSAGGAPADACGVGVQTGQVWVDLTPSSTALVPGSGGPLRFGEYRLTGLAEHGARTCLTVESVAQTLAFRDGGRGSVVSDTREGEHFAAAFTFAFAENRIQFTPTCTDPQGMVSEASAFGPFETFTATGDSLVLVSEACRYSAAYVFMPIPTR